METSPTTRLSLTSRVYLALHELGIGTEPKAIPALADELAGRLGISRVRAQRLVDALSRHGRLRVERPTRHRGRAGPGRGRATRYALTETGEARLKRLLARLSKGETAGPGLQEPPKTSGDLDPVPATVTVTEGQDEDLDYAEDRKHLASDEPSAPTGTGSTPENGRGLSLPVTEERNSYKEEQPKEPTHSYPEEETKEPTYSFDNDDDLRVYFRKELNIGLDTMRNLPTLVREHLAQVRGEEATRKKRRELHAATRCP